MKKKILSVITVSMLAITCLMAFPSVCSAAEWKAVLRQFPGGKCSFIDLNNDGNSDLIIVTQNQVRFYINNNGSYDDAGYVAHDGYPNLCIAKDNSNIAMISNSYASAFSTYIIDNGKLKPTGNSTDSETITANYKYISTQKYSATDYEDWYTAYKSVIDQYNNYLGERFNPSFDIDSNNPPERYNNINTRYFVTGGSPYYYLKDLDNNGTPELFIACAINDSNFFVLGDYYDMLNICTFDDGVLFVNTSYMDAGTHNNSYITNTAEILGVEIMGATLERYDFFTLKDGKFVFSDKHKNVNVPAGYDIEGVLPDKPVNEIINQSGVVLIKPEWKPIGYFPNEEPVNVILNGQKIDFNGQRAFLDGNTTYVPMRAIFEALGATVEWNSSTQAITARKNDIEIKLAINNNKATINGESSYLASPPKLVDGTTVVPLRFISEALGAGVSWDGATRTVTING